MQCATPDDAIARAGSSDTPNTSASNICTMVFESWKTNFGRVASHGKTKKPQWPLKKYVYFLASGRGLQRFFRLFSAALSLNYGRKKIIGVSPKNNTAVYSCFFVWS